MPPGLVEVGGIKWYWYKTERLVFSKHQVSLITINILIFLLLGYSNSLLSNIPVWGFSSQQAAPNGFCTESFKI